MNEVINNDGVWTSGMLGLAGLTILAIFLGGWWMVKSLKRGNQRFRSRQTRSGGTLDTETSDDPATRRFQSDPW
jgi:hypothetical protein